MQDVPFIIQREILSYCSLHEQSLFAQCSKQSNQIFQKKLNTDLERLFGIKLSSENLTKEAIIQRNTLLKFVDIYNRKYNSIDWHNLEDVKQVHGTVYKNCFLFSNLQSFLTKLVEPELIRCDENGVQTETEILDKKYLHSFLSNVQIKNEHKASHLIIKPYRIDSIAGLDKNSMLLKYNNIQIDIEKFIGSPSKDNEDKYTQFRINYQKSLFSLGTFLSKKLPKEARHKLLQLLDKNYKKVIINNLKINQDTEYLLRYPSVMKYLQERNFEFKNKSFILSEGFNIDCPAVQVDFDKLFFNIFSNNITSIEQLVNYKLCDIFLLTQKASKDDFDMKAFDKLISNAEKTLKSENHWGKKNCRIF